MAWKLWLDDDIHNPEATERHTPEGFIGAASVDEAIDMICHFGYPEFMDLDHDLGEVSSGVKAKDGMAFLKNLYFLMPAKSLPPKWNIHSKNVGGGAANMASYLRSWEKSLE